jgi:hypothetical protein
MLEESCPFMVARKQREAMGRTEGQEKSFKDTLPGIHFLHKALPSIVPPPPSGLLKFQNHEGFQTIHSLGQSPHDLISGNSFTDISRGVLY